MTNITKIFLWCLSFVPLIVDNTVFSPYVSGKNLFIEVAVILSQLFFVINILNSEDFRSSVLKRFRLIFKNPLFISVALFVLFTFVSTIFSLDKYLAFWGETERAEGLAGIMFFFNIFVLSALVFEKKDWVTFYKLTLVASFVMVFYQMIQFHQGIIRPGSFAGNPTFLAGYLLFSIMSALIVMGEVSAKAWKYFSVVVIFLSILGIFIAQTRGTIVGLVIGVITILLVSIYKGGLLFNGRLSIRKLSASILILIILFLSSFIMTKENKIWQQIPGLARVAVINTDDVEDRSTDIRLMVYRVGLISVNPISNGWKKALIGWGPENFILAFAANYNSDLFKYQKEWSDRPHNKLIEILVTCGVVGLLSYLLLWASYFFCIIRTFKFRLLDLALIFLGVAFLTHLLFVFDQITTSAIFFVTISFAVGMSSGGGDSLRSAARVDVKRRSAFKILGPSLSFLFLSFSFFVFAKNTLPAYLQMKNYVSRASGAEQQNVGVLISSFEPFTTAQRDIRKDILRREGGQTLEKTIVVSEEYIARRPLDFRFSASFADVLNFYGSKLKRDDYIKKAEFNFRQALFSVKNRPDYNYGLALNLFYQRRQTESLGYFERAFDLDRSLFRSNKDLDEGFYESFVKYFYDSKDLIHFLTVARRLASESDYANAGLYKNIVRYIESSGTLPSLNFR